MQQEHEEAYRHLQQEKQKQEKKTQQLNQRLDRLQTQHSHLEREAKFLTEVRNIMSKQMGLTLN